MNVETDKSEVRLLNDKVAQLSSQLCSLTARVTSAEKLITDNTISIKTLQNQLTGSANYTLNYLDLVIIALETE